MIPSEVLNRIEEVVFHEIRQPRNYSSVLRCTWVGKKTSVKRAVPHNMRAAINMASVIPETKAWFAPSLIGPEISTGRSLTVI